MVGVLTLPLAQPVAASLRHAIALLGHLNSVGPGGAVLAAVVGAGAGALTLCGSVHGRVTRPPFPPSPEQPTPLSNRLRCATKKGCRSIHVCSDRVPFVPFVSLDGGGSCRRRSVRFFFAVLVSAVGCLVVHCRMVPLSVLPSAAPRHGGGTAVPSRGPGRRLPLWGLRGGMSGGGAVFSVFRFSGT